MKHYQAIKDKVGGKSECNDRGRKRWGMGFAYEFKCLRHQVKKCYTYDRSGAET